MISTISARVIECYLFHFTFVLVKYIGMKKNYLVEGSLRCEELKNYLNKIGAPKEIWLSEDGTRIVQRATYDMRSNKIVGINLPINGLTGMPITESYLARTLSEISSHMENELSSTVYVVMAQPIKPKSAPFVLQLFGTNNTFTAQNVLDRWDYTLQELKKYVEPDLLSSYLTEFLF